MGLIIIYRYLFLNLRHGVLASSVVWLKMAGGSSRGSWWIHEKIKALWHSPGVWWRLTGKFLSEKSDIWNVSLCLQQSGMLECFLNISEFCRWTLPVQIFQKETLQRSILFLASYAFKNRHFQRGSKNSRQLDDMMHFSPLVQLVHLWMVSGVPERCLLVEKHF